MHLVPVTINNIIIISIMASVGSKIFCMYLASLYRLHVGMVCRVMLKYVGVVGLFTHNIAT